MDTSNIHNITATDLSFDSLMTYSLYGYFPAGFLKDMAPTKIPSLQRLKRALIIKHPPPTPSRGDYL
jgi:hypothetical protein